MAFRHDKEPSHSAAVAFQTPVQQQGEIPEARSPTESDEPQLHLCRSELKWRGESRPIQAEALSPSRWRLLIHLNTRSYILANLVLNLESSFFLNFFQQEYTPAHLICAGLSF